MASHARTGEVQRRLLTEMVARHRDTAFGRDHGFASVRNYGDFRSVVPVGNYETLRPYMDRVFAGEFGALIPPGEEVLMFARTSGTTGRPKHIPVTRRFAECQKRGFNMFGLRVLRDHPAGWLRDICQVSSPMREGDSPTGLPCGAISGLLAERQMSIVRRMYVVPPEVTALGDADARYYLTLRCGVGRDVGIVTTANPSTTIRLAETAAAHAERLIRDVAEGKASPPGGLPRSMADVLRFRPNRALAARMEAGVARDGALRPRHFWNLAFLTNWTGGTLKLYLPRLRELYGRVPMRDIGLLASEGRLSLPIEDDTPAGIAEITGNFLEFVPAGQADSPQPDTLTAEQVESGGEYSLVVTNWAGLWRYNMDDRVRVCGFQGRSPVFEFLSRGSSTASITGEKLTEHQVVEAMRAALHGSAGRIERFVMQPVFDELPRYELRMEVPEGVDAASIAEGVDRALAELNVEYRSKRATRRLGPVRPVVLEPGTLAAIEDERIAARGGRSEQYKHQYLLTDVRQAKALS
jgi:hypothetical protein